jgi:CBS domain-containing protein
VKVADLMTSKVISVRGDDSLSEAIRLLADGHVSGLPVVDRHGAVIGVVSSSDIMEAEADGEGATPEGREEVLVEEVMTRKPFMIEAEAELREAAQQMLYGEVHRLFVHADRKLVGVISQTDIVRAVAGGMLVKAPAGTVVKGAVKPAPLKGKPPARPAKAKKH